MSPVAISPEIMNQIYALVGFVVLSCATTIITVVIVAIKGTSKLTWTLSKFDTRVENVESDLDAYHSKHRQNDEIVGKLRENSVIHQTVLEHHESRLDNLESRRR